ncbi:MAG TPA: ATP-binding protein [Acidobacteriaceae bacterium]|nr:ATP-binding protein [Acidobacteriaceae bacterium]
MREFRRILLQALYFPILLLLLLAAFFLQEVGVSSNLQKSIAQNDLVANRVVELQRQILEQEAAISEYELTDNGLMLRPYDREKAGIALGFAELRRQLQGDPIQIKRVATLSRQYDEWFALAESILTPSYHRAGTFSEYARGEAMMDSIRATANTIQQSEREKRAILTAQLPDLEHRQFVQILSASLCIAMAMALFMRHRLKKVSGSYTSALDEVEQSSREVQESRQRYRTTLESIGDAVISCDIRGRVEFLNRIASDLSGWPMQDALGRPLTEVFRIVHEETREPAENPVQAVLGSKEMHSLPQHTVLISRMGKEYLIDDSAAPVLGSDGEMTGVVLVFRDVTEQRRSEAALISGEKLAVAGRLAASIAHEIHNPLDSVSNLLFLLRDEVDPERRTEYLGMAEQELNRTMQISRTMLSLYREPKSPVKVDLKELMQSVLLLLDRRIVQQRVQITSELEEACIIEGFPAELRQVVTNVLLNGIEAAGQDGRMLVRLELSPAEEFRGEGAVIEVIDSGPGITDFASQHIFTPFFTTKGEQGTGLGLWVSMGIVQKHGGMIRLQNCGLEDYSGACARIYLPVKTLAGERPMASTVA